MSVSWNLKAARPLCCSGARGRGGGLGCCWGRKDESVKGWGSLGGQSPCQKDREAEILPLGAGGGGVGMLRFPGP